MDRSAKKIMIALTYHRVPKGMPRDGPPTSLASSTRSRSNAQSADVRAGTDLPI